MLSLARSGLRVPAGGLRLHSTRRDLLFPSAHIGLRPRRIISSQSKSPESKSPVASDTQPAPDAKEDQEAGTTRPRSQKKQARAKSKAASKGTEAKQPAPAKDAESDAKADGQEDHGLALDPVDPKKKRALPESWTPGARAEKRRHKLAQSKARANASRADQIGRMWRESLEILKDLRAAHVSVARPAASTAKGKSPAQAGEGAGEGASEPVIPPKDWTRKNSADAYRAAKLMEVHRARASPGSSDPSIFSLRGLPSEKILKTVKPDDKDRQVELLAGALGVLRKVLLEKPPGAAQHAAPAAPERGGSQPSRDTKDKPDAARPMEPMEIRRVVGKTHKQAGMEEPNKDVAKSMKKKATLASQFQQAPPTVASSSKQTKKKTGEASTIKFLDEEPAAPLPKKQKKKSAAKPISIHSVSASDLVLTPIDKPQPPVPKIQYGLDRVLFNPGVYQLQDPRSRVYNFDPYLSTIMPTHEFDFNALKRYVTSSKDYTLINLAAEVGKKYTGSTSSMTSTLSHFHYLISAWRPINAIHTTRGFSPDSEQFTRIQRGPAAVFLHYRDGAYAIDADKEFDNATILSMLGKSMEKFLTLPREEYELYHKDKSHELSEEARNDPEAFHYTTLGDFLMRSQLDAQDPRLPGTGMFDLKTRAVVTIRMQSSEIHKGMGYEIRDRFGQWESFEREYFDMIRSAFLKYSLQVRMGRMDGIFVAFHNTERIFGFQYIPLAEMDLALHGTDNTELGDQEFKLSLHLLNKILDKATAKFPKRSLRLHFETRPSDPPFMYVFAKPVTDQEIVDVQEKNKAAVEDFERRMMNLEPESPAAEAVEQSEEAGSAEDELEVIDEDEGAEEDEVVEGEEESPSEGLSPEEVWEDMMNRVDQAIEDDALGVASVREAVEEALTQSGLLRSIPPDQSREYIEALLGAITSPDLEGAAEAIENDSKDVDGEDSPIPSRADEYATAPSPEEQFESQAEVEEALADEATETSEDNVAETAEDEVAESPEDEAMQTAAESENIVDEDEVEEDDAEAAESETSVDDSDSAEPGAAKSKKAPELLSLKNLIIKLAEHSQSSPVPVSAEPTQKEEEPDRADSRRLKKFERILSEMLSNSKQAEGAAAASETPATSEAETSATDAEQAPEKDELMAIAVTVRNSTNRGYVKRLNNVTKDTRWELLYSFEEIEGDRAHKLYEGCKYRRESLLTAANEPLGTEKYGQAYAQTLDNFTQKGRTFRVAEDKRAREHGKVLVYGVDEPLEYDEVFAHVPATRAWSTIDLENDDFPEMELNGSEKDDGKAKVEGKREKNPPKSTSKAARKAAEKAKRLKNFAENRAKKLERKKREKEAAEKTS